MNIHAKPDWIGTPRRYYEEQTEVLAIDFSLENNDNRYRLIIRTNGTGVQYECKQYGVKPGSQKPYPIDIPFTNDMMPLVETILQDPYVKACL